MNFAIRYRYLAIITWIVCLSIKSSCNRKTNNKISDIPARSRICAHERTLSAGKYLKNPKIKLGYIRAEKAKVWHYLGQTPERRTHRDDPK